MLFETMELAGARSGPKVLITGGVHGDEFEPMAAIRRLARVIRPEGLAGHVTLVPVVNESAFARGMRTADDGLDLARTFPGNPNGTITERVASELAPLIGDCDFYIDLHTGGTRLRVLPLVGYMLHPDANVLNAQRKMARAFGQPIVWGTDWRLEGRSLSVARDAGVPAIYAEYQGGGRCDPAGIEAYVAGCLGVLADLGMVPVPPATRSQSRPTLVVEDDRPGAGHMQVNHPSPISGFFEAAVDLGDRVAAGDLIGTVSDTSGKQVISMTARYAGIVLVLHTFARIDAGTSVAVLLETSRELSEVNS